MKWNGYKNDNILMLNDKMHRARKKQNQNKNICIYSIVNMMKGETLSEESCNKSYV